MSLERGTRPGAPRTDEPGDSTTRIAIAAVVVGASLILAIVLALGALGSGGTASPSQAFDESRDPSASPSTTASPSFSPSPSVSPSPATTFVSGPVTLSPDPSDSPDLSSPELAPSPTETPAPLGSPSPAASPSASPSPAASPSTSPGPVASPSAPASPSSSPVPTAGASIGPDPTAVGDDPEDLPRFPGAMLLTHELQQEHGLARLRIEYQTTAPLDRVRRHYRVMLRRHGWFVGDVEYRDDRWDIAANRGGREASVELRAEGTGTDVRVEISWPTQAVPGGGDQGGPGGGGDQGGRGGGDHSGPGGGPGGGGGSDHSGPGG